MADSAQSWDEVVVERVSELVERQVVAGEKLTLVRYVYQPGAIFPLHAHASEQLTLVERGQLVITLGDETTVVLGPGQMLRIPGEAPHSARVAGEEIVVSLNFFAPARSSHPSG